MAAAMQKVFGDLLLTEPVDKNETALPSPEKLKERILIKHKKLPDNVQETSFVVPKESNDGMFERILDFCSLPFAFATIYSGHLPVISFLILFFMPQILSFCLYPLSSYSLTLQILMCAFKLYFRCRARSSKHKLSRIFACRGYNR